MQANQADFKATPISPKSYVVFFNHRQTPRLVLIKLAGLMVISRMIKEVPFARAVRQVRMPITPRLDLETADIAGKVGAFSHGEGC